MLLQAFLSTEGSDKAFYASAGYDDTENDGNFVLAEDLSCEAVINFMYEAAGFQNCEDYGACALSADLRAEMMIAKGAGYCEFTVKPIRERVSAVSVRASR